MEYTLLLNILLVTKLLCMFPKLSRLAINFDETKFMLFVIEDDKLLEKYNNIWNKVSINKTIVSKNNLRMNQYSMKNI